jgi:hypothetical protein
MAQQHEWMTDGIALDASERILAEYEAEGWQLVTLSWDSQAGVFMGVWKRPVKPKPRESASEAGMADSASEWTKAWRIIIDALKDIGVPNVDHNARAIIARLAGHDLLIVRSEKVKD